MRFKVCDKCGEFVAKTGFISSQSSAEGKNFARCHNKICKKTFSEKEYLKLKEEEY